MNTFLTEKKSRTYYNIHKKKILVQTSCGDCKFGGGKFATFPLYLVATLEEGKGERQPSPALEW